MRTKKPTIPRKKTRKPLRKEIDRQQIAENGTVEWIEPHLTTPQTTIDDSKFSVKALADQFSVSLLSISCKSNFCGWSKVDMRDYIGGVNGANAVTVNTKRKIARGKLTRVYKQPVTSTIMHPDPYKFSLHSDISGYIEEYRSEKLDVWKKTTKKQMMNHLTSVQDINSTTGNTLKVTSKLVKIIQQLDKE